MQAAFVPLGAFLLGVVFGVVAQRSHFCTMGCLSDAFLFGSLRRLRVWALALAVALLGSQALDLAGFVDLGASLYRAPTLPWLGILAGGVLFGFGMVLAGGCIGRNLVRLGTGSLKALVTLLVLAVTAHATLAGVLAPLPSALHAVGTVDLAGDIGLHHLIARALGLPPGPLGFVLTVVAVVAIVVFVLRDPVLRRSPTDLATGVALGALIPAGWLLTAGAGQPQSLTFVVPAADGLSALMDGGSMSFGPALVVGVVLGAALAAAGRGQLRLETFVGRDDMVRHLVGAALMGLGGVLALGCTVGQGLTGVATLSLGSAGALAAIVGGGWWGLRYLETGLLLSIVPWSNSRPTAPP